MDVPDRGGSADSIGDHAKVGIVTVSDRASAGKYDDKSGPAILQVPHISMQFFHEALESSWEAHYRLVSDDLENIQAALIELVDTVGCCFVVTTGGTGPAPRDNTPEATEAVCSKLMPGFGEKMRSISLKYVPTAILSRQTAGIRGSCLILNLPGSPKSIREILDEIFSAVPYCVDLVGGPYMETNTAVVSAFRPVKDRRPPQQGA